MNGVCYVSTGCAPAGVFDNRVAVRPAARQRRVGHRRPGQQRAPRRLRAVLQPEHGQRRVRQHAAPGAECLSGRRPTSGRVSSYGNGAGLNYDTAHEATLANRIGSIGINSLDAGFVHLPEDAQLQPVVRASDLREPGGRGQLRRHARPRPRQPQQRQRDALRRAELGHVQRRRPVDPGQPGGGCERGDNLAVVPAVQRAQRTSRSTTSAASRTTTRCR